MTTNVLRADNTAAGLVDNGGAHLATDIISLNCQSYGHDSDDDDGHDTGTDADTKVGTDDGEDDENDGD